MPHYDATRFEPPAPLAQVTICNPDNGTLNPDVPMLLDSGADVTLIDKYRFYDKILSKYFARRKNYAPHTTSVRFKEPVQ